MLIVDGAWCAVYCSFYLDKVKIPFTCFQSQILYPLVLPVRTPAKYVSCSFYCRFEAIMLVFIIPHQNITWHLKGIYWILYGCNKTQWKILRNGILPICFWLLMHGLTRLKCQVILHWPLPEVQIPKHKSLLLLYFTTLLEKDFELYVWLSFLNGMKSLSARDKPGPVK